MIKRIREFIENQGISVRAFEQKISASNGLIRKAIANNTDIQSKWITNIVENYPQISIDWLITGQGPMLREENKTTNNREIYKDEQNHEMIALQAEQGIPLIPEYAFAGFAPGDSNQILELGCERYVIPHFHDADGLIYVKGSSMYPKYSSGDIVAFKKLSLTTFFQWNKVYILDTEQGILIKRVQQADDSEHIILVSENPSYKPFSLALTDIYSIAIVVGVIRLE